MNFALLDSLSLTDLQQCLTVVTREFRQNPMVAATIDTLSLSPWARSSLELTILEIVAPHLVNVRMELLRSFPTESIQKIFPRFTSKLKSLALNLKAFRFPWGGAEGDADLAGAGWAGSVVHVGRGTTATDRDTTARNRDTANRDTTATNRDTTATNGIVTLAQCWKIFEKISLITLILEGFQTVPANVRVHLMEAILVSSAHSLQTLHLDGILEDRYTEPLVALVTTMRNLQALEIVCNNGVGIANALARRGTSFQHLNYLVIDDSNHRLADVPPAALAEDFAEILYRMDPTNAYVGLCFHAWMDAFSARLARDAGRGTFFKGNLLLAVGPYVSSPLVYQNLWEASEHMGMDLAEGDTVHSRTFCSFQRRRDLILYQDPGWDQGMDDLLQAIQFMYGPFQLLYSLEFYHPTFLWENDHASTAFGQLPNLRTVQFHVAPFGEASDLMAGIEFITKLPTVRDVTVHSQLPNVDPLIIRQAFLQFAENRQLEKVKMYANLDMNLVNGVISVLMDMACRAQSLPFRFDLVRLQGPLFDKEVSYLQGPFLPCEDVLIV